MSTKILSTGTSYSDLPFYEVETKLGKVWLIPQDADVIFWTTEDPKRYSQEAANSLLTIRGIPYAAHGHVFLVNGEWSANRANPGRYFGSEVYLSRQDERRFEDASKAANEAAVAAILTAVNEWDAKDKATALLRAGVKALDAEIARHKARLDELNNSLAEVAEKIADAEARRARTEGNLNLHLLEEWKAGAA